MGEACFSVPVLALLVPIAGALAAAIGVMYRAGEKSHEREIDNCNQLLSAANARLTQGIPAMDQAETTLRGVARSGRQRS
jgi:hypothetical protein